MEEPDGATEPPRRVCYMHERAVPVRQTVEELDLREEGERGRARCPHAPKNPTPRHSSAPRRH